MRKKIILTGIVLLTILSSCSERDEEIHPKKITETSKIGKDQFKVPSKIIIDSLKKQNVNEKELDQARETIDPKDVTIPPH